MDEGSLGGLLAGRGKFAAAAGGAALLGCYLSRRCLAAEAVLWGRLLGDGMSRVALTSPTDGTDQLALWRRLRRVWELWCLLRIERQHQRDVRRLESAGGDWGTVFEQEQLAHVRHLKMLKQLPNATELLKQAQETPVVKSLVLVGGGHSHVHVLRMLGMEPLPGVRVTLITRDVETPYSGMLPGHIAGFYTRQECHIDLNRMARFAKVRLVHGTVIGIDRDQNRVVLDGDRPPILFDVLSINIGSAPRVVGDAAPRVGPGAAAARAASVVPVKPIDSFGARWDSLLQRIAQWRGTKRVAVVGGGAGGAELALAVEARLRLELAKAGGLANVAVFLVTRSGLLPSHTPGVRALMRACLMRRGVELHTGCEVQSAEGGELRCADGREFRYDECIWCTQGAPQPWVAQCGLGVDEGGFLVVNQNMQCSGGNGRIFAAGDIAAIAGYPRPKAGVFAVMAGMPLWLNIKATLQNRPLVKYYPQASFLGLLGTGDGGCIASRGDLATEGSWLWELKDWIDRKWMYAYTAGLPDMKPPEVQVPPAVAAAGGDALEVLRHAAMRCGGCGAKVGEGALSLALSRIQIPQQPAPDARARVVLGAGDDAAVVDLLGQGDVPVVASVQTIDFFRAFIDDPYTFGRIAAVHALSDCDAMGGVPQTATALVQLPYATEEHTADDLAQLMAGACAGLKDAGCALVGGHTCEAKEMGIGFSVVGMLPKGSRSAMRKDALRPGDVLIITKPIGTGALFAADMRVKARGPWVQAALRSMGQSNREAARIMREHGCQACTDITGFGLVGHLYEMLKASGARAVIDIDAIPLYAGALEAVAQGIFSSLQPANTRLRRAVERADAVACYKAYPLLFDPQTSGGLIGAVPQRQGEACAEALRKVYPHACVFGDVVSGSPGSRNPRVDGDHVSRITIRSSARSPQLF